MHDHLRAVRHPIGRLSIAGLALSIVLVGSGCAETFDARALGARTTLSSRTTEQPQGDSFKITKTAVYVLWGLGTASRPSLERILAGQLTGDAEIANLRITARSRFGDGLLTVLTAGLVVSRGITYEGVIVHPTAAPAAKE